MADVKGLHISYQYQQNHKILDDIDFMIRSGKLTAVLGKNGCGKSTLVKLITALLPLTEGTIYINDIDINGKNGKKILCEHCGIVFQNPDNQFVSPIIEDDIKFGLSNHHIPENQFKYRIEAALNEVGLKGFEKRPVSTLSGGQKQLAAVAGILASDNDIFIFDEAASMLDPQGKEELNSCIQKLRKQNKTIILITQDINDALCADDVILMANRKILRSGSVREILTDYDLLQQAGVKIPFPVRIYHDLLQNGVKLSRCPLFVEELAEVLC